MESQHTVNRAGFSVWKDEVADVAWIVMKGSSTATKHEDLQQQQQQQQQQQSIG
jgi:hypothetical protein